MKIWAISDLHLGFSTGKGMDQFGEHWEGHHEKVEAAWRELLRVLRPGGTIVVTMVNRWAIDGYWLYERLQVRRASRGSTAVRAHCEFVTPGQVRRDLVRLGAGSVAIHGRLLLPLRWVYKVSRSLGRVVARILNPVDDLLCRIPGTAGLTGHLVVVVRP